ncbi:hypothetical protein AMJ80_04050 [bacterium SM23_31]|nr:MAG: hypothetical protein AMJ80_04050 [bacterium SM23_31]
MRFLKLFLLISIVVFAAFSCSREKDTFKVEVIEGVKTVHNVSPKYEDKEFVTLKELHTIETFGEEEDFLISAVNEMEVDDEDNLYLLGFYESTITKFDRNGSYIKTMGREGEGPSDLIRPRLFSIHDNKFYINQQILSTNNINIKVWDMDGKYVELIRMPLENYDFIKAYDDFFVVLKFVYRTVYSQSAVNKEQIEINGGPSTPAYIIEKMTKDFKVINLIASFVYENGAMSSPNFNVCDAITSQNEIYFPASSTEYAINKFDFDGNLVLSFNRTYERIPYSQTAKEYDTKRREEAKKNFEKMFPGQEYRGRAALPKYPPILRKILVDDYDNVWVVAGEYSEEINTDYDNKIEATVDIFDKNGVYLYTFKSLHIGLRSFIKNNRLYSVDFYHEATEPEIIRVFEITYNF